MSSIFHTPGDVTTSTWSGTHTYGEIATFEAEHKGAKIVIRTQPVVQEFEANEHRGATRHERTLGEVIVDGRYFGQRPAGTDVQAAKKVAKKLDEIAENESLLPRVRAVIANGLPPFAVGSVQVNDIVSVHSMGQWRQGIVVSIAKTRATVAYTSASNPTRIFRKAEPITSLRRF